MSCQLSRVYDKCMNYQDVTNRSSHPEVFCEKGVLRNFAKFTGTNLCWCFLFNKVQGRQPLKNLKSFSNFSKAAFPATLLTKRFWHKCFPVHFAIFLRTPFVTEHLRWLLLK